MKVHPLVIGAVAVVITAAVFTIPRFVKPAQKSPNLHVTLYEGGQVVREWNTTAAQTSNSGCLDFTDAATGLYVLIRGTYTLETLPKP